MKKLFCILALIVGINPFAQAQVYFDSGSARPNNPGGATREIDQQAVARPRARVQRKLVRCRDGSKHIANVCRRHGGLAARQQS